MNGRSSRPRIRTAVLIPANNADEKRKRTGRSGRSKLIPHAQKATSLPSGACLCGCKRKTRKMFPDPNGQRSLKESSPLEGGYRESMSARFIGASTPSIASIIDGETKNIATSHVAQNPISPSEVQRDAGAATGCDTRNEGERRGTMISQTTGNALTRSLVRARKRIRDAPDRTREARRGRIDRRRE